MLRRSAILTTFAVVAVLVLTSWQQGRPIEAANGSWSAEYFNNASLTGSPVLSRNDGTDLDFFWEDNPGPGVNGDNWSARWQRTDTYAAGTYRLTALADDGVRLYVDNVLVLNAWVNQPPTTYFTDVALSAGSHTIKVELYDAGNAATITFSIVNVASIPSGWQGQYFDNQTLDGSPVRTRNDGEVIDFTWNSSAPGSPFPGVIPNNNFSIRWTRTMNFNDGVYQFTSISDDGVRVYVDGQLIIDYWIDQPPTEHSANKQMTPGAHTVVVEYYEATGGASMFLDVQFRPDLGGFVTDTIASGLDVSTSFAFAPDGRVFFAEKDGGVAILKNGSVLGTPFYTVPNVASGMDDRGLLGITLHPNFASNGWVYLAYTYDSNPASPNGAKTAQVIRVRAVNGSGNPIPLADVATPSTKQVLLGTVVGTPADPSCEDFPSEADCIPSDHLSHSMGNLRFGPDGKLYVETGDGASYSVVDPRALRSQDIDRLSGKILRVDPDTGAGLSDNPFYNGDPAATRSKVYAYGFRNAFRFNFKPGTTTIFNGDVGWNTWEEINVITPGANYGWPCYEGADQQDGYAAFDECQDLYGAGGVTPPLYEYEHPPDSAAVGGAFTGVNSYPAQFHNTFFWADYARGQISILKVNASNQLIPGSVDVFSTFSNEDEGPVQVEVGPNGDVYYLALNLETFSSQLRRIRFVGGNRAPDAVANGTPTNGAAPLNVSFSSAGSSDPDAGQVLTYDWDFGDGTAHSTSANPSHAYTSVGIYTATLTVTDPLFVTDTDTVTITVGNQAPTAIINTPADDSHFDIGQLISFTGTGSDPEDGTIPTGSRAWLVTLKHCNEIALINCHSHPGSPSTGAGGSFLAEDHGDFTYYEIKLTVTDSGGLQDSETFSVTPNRVDLSFASNKPGVQITVNGTSGTVPFTRSVPRGSTQSIFTASPQTSSGSQVYYASWSDGGAQLHSIVASANATYTATFSDSACPGDADCDGVLDASDNCPSVANSNQANRNGEITDIPGSPFDDHTNPIASPLGDACNADVDHDGLTGAQETTAGTNADIADTDADRVRDGAEVACGSDPLSAASKPTGTDGDGDGLPNACEAAAGTASNDVDSDDDGVADGTEFLRAGTNPLVTNTDGDACNDGGELASVNADTQVNILDISAMAVRFNAAAGGPLYFFVFDPTGDGFINILDLAFAGGFFGPCEQ